MADPTFRNFSAAQARGYAKYRKSSYPPELYQTILDYHYETNHGRGSNSNGQLDLLLDVGCGPGKVVFDLLPCFNRAIGIDPGREMIEAAKEDERYAEAKGKALFQVAGAEQCGEVEGVAGQVDVLTVAMAAHWFDMSAFYESAAKVLKPGGTLAMWTCSSYYAHPSNPRAKELQAVLSHFEDVVLGPYATAGNKLSRDGYKDLPLPWDIPSAASDWEAASFIQEDWDLNGVPSGAPGDDGQPAPYLIQGVEVAAKFGEGLGASSMGARWREANEEKVESGELEDCGVEASRKLEQVLRGTGQTSFVAGPSCSLLLLSRS